MLSLTFEKEGRKPNRALHSDKHFKKKPRMNKASLQGSNNKPELWFNIFSANLSCLFVCITLCLVLSFATKYVAAKAALKQHPPVNEGRRQQPPPPPFSQRRPRLILTAIEEGKEGATACCRLLLFHLGKAAGDAP